MDRIRALRRPQSKLTKEASNSQLEAKAKVLLAALGPCITEEQQKVSDLVQTITRDLSLLEQDTQTHNKIVNDMNITLNKIRDKNPEQEREWETKIQTTIQGFVQGKIDKKMPTLASQVDEVFDLIEQKIELPDAELGSEWFEEVIRSTKVIANYTKG
ncbi:hypothetical protein L211DRAFT_846129 [Terfezia boudieri ATCC MYA-4762]|uniref:Uncharacterized protein n=1 Tax=Terfezia boudieri ATCC MYA-4762 TaxID=1051890 RepID=A0A3N4M0D2_9PEZI|nr:hypothetical protein L211DRAFT_846129 [Terfezia boudieri ATCC MYA-4762]